MSPHDRATVDALRDAITVAIDVLIVAERARADSYDRMDPMSLICEGRITGMVFAQAAIDKQWRRLREAP